MKNIPLLIATILGTLALVIGISFFFSRQSQQATAPADLAKVLGSSRLTKGAKEATVTVTEFSDFQCPACRAVSPLIQQAYAQYGDRVAFVYRHYPLHSIHPYAQIAAQASEVAAEQNKFWEYHDLLFEKQQEWASLKNIDEVKTKLGEYAEQIQIDKAAFLERIESDEIKDRVATDINDGNTLGIDSTPTIYVNNQQLSAPQDLVSVIESQLQTQQ